MSRWTKKEGRRLEVARMVEEERGRKDDIGTTVINDFGFCKILGSKLQNP